ncbi:hypothetical protein E8E14_005173 [Neopestalotiopsis sp. 37M]|nr:hypothetical protein E8E14_005173 [Neopestalotiopsis sp. 37M]
MLVEVIRPKYACASDRTYYKYIGDSFMHKDTTPVIGGFKINGLSDNLIVAVPTDFAKHLKEIGVPSKPRSNAVFEDRIKTAIMNFMKQGDIDRYGLHNCVLLDASEEDIEYCRLESQLPEDYPVHELIRKDPFAAKIFASWDPKATTVVFDADKKVTSVTFVDDDGNVIMKVCISENN